MQGFIHAGIFINEIRLKSLKSSSYFTFLSLNIFRSKPNITKAN